MWVITAIIALIVLYSILHFMGKPKFWKLTRKYPVEAYKFFLANDCWFVVDGVNNSEPPKDKQNWNGPFSFFLPHLNKRIKIYGKSPEYEISEDIFIKKFG